jgi:Ca-activated chloride channel family protein
MYFLYPFVCFLLVLPLFSLFYRLNTSSNSLSNYFSEDILKKLSLSSGYLNHRIKYRLFLLVLALFIIALARPVKPIDYLDASITKASVIIALDVSKSMHSTDIYPSRLALAKAKLTRLLSLAQGFTVGILLYAENAYVLYPLSETPTLLSTLVKDMNLTQQFAPNSNLFAALQGAEILLQEAQNKHIILLSDGGEDISRDKELRYLKSKHITLWSLVLSPKTNTSLLTLTQGSHGLYQPYTWGDEALHILLRSIKKTKAKSQAYHYEVAQYEEYFTYPLFLALCLLLLLFSPLKNFKRTFLILPFIVIDLSTPLQAGIFDFWYLHEAKQAYTNKSYKDALISYKKADLSPKVHYNLATTFYSTKEYSLAIQHYEKALGQDKKMNAKIYYNIATAYARRDKLDLAKTYYEMSLSSYEYKIALDNLNTIKKQLSIQRKNLHKKYQKLYFKALGKNDYAQNATFTNYAIKIHDYLPSAEELWFQKILKHKAPLYLQRLTTTKRSDDANHTW